MLELTSASGDKYKTWVYEEDINLIYSILDSKIKEDLDKSDKYSKEEKDALKRDLASMEMLARKAKQSGPDVVVSSEFRELFKMLKDKQRGYANTPKELSKAEREKLQKLLQNKELLRKMMNDLKNGQSQLAKSGG